MKHVELLHLQNVTINWFLLKKKSIQFLTSIFRVEVFFLLWSFCFNTIGPYKLRSNKIMASHTSEAINKLSRAWIAAVFVVLAKGVEVIRKKNQVETRISENLVCVVYVCTKRVYQNRFFQC